MGGSVSSIGGEPRFFALLRSSPPDLIRGSRISRRFNGRMDCRLKSGNDDFGTVNGGETTELFGDLN
jgi:hypothetical protein